MQQGISTLAQILSDITKWRESRRVRLGSALTRTQPQGRALARILREGPGARIEALSSLMYHSGLTETLGPVWYPDGPAVGVTFARRRWYSTSTMARTAVPLTIISTVLRLPESSRYHGLVGTGPASGALSKNSQPFPLLKACIRPAVSSVTVRSNGRVDALRS